MRAGHSPPPYPHPRPTVPRSRHCQVYYGYVMRVIPATRSGATLLYLYGIEGAADPRQPSRGHALGDRTHTTATMLTTPIAKRRVRRASAAFGGSKQAAAQLQALLEAAPDAAVIVDAAGRIVIVNGQVERLFGYARAELPDQPVELLLPGYSPAARTRRWQP
jgi:PAS domain-containing protein